jgi:hypothetical protein
MPFDGERAGYRALHRVAESEKVKQLLRRARVYKPATDQVEFSPSAVPPAAGPLADLVVAIDGSATEEVARNGYPGARIGYITVASVLLNVRRMDELDEDRPADPREFRKVEEAAAVDAALPGTNVITRDHGSARDAFREELFDTFHDRVVDEEDGARLLDTYEALLAHKPKSKPQACPYEPHGCDQQVTVGPGVTSCPCDRRRRVYATDALRIHERFADLGTNGEAFGQVMFVWERILLVHLLRSLERRDMLGHLGRIAFFVDGPLGVFGPPAWLSAAISRELKRLNVKAREATGSDLVIVGVEKTGAFVSHFEDIDRTEEPGRPRFDPGTFFLLTDGYIKKRINFTTSDKRYGADTYFGRKFFYKTRNGSRLVASIPFLTEAQDTIETSDVTLYPQFGTVCALLDKLATKRFPNAVAPLVSAHANAAIPLRLGSKVLQQLARALMRQQ